MGRFLIRLGISALSLWFAAWMVDGVAFPGNPPGAMQVILVALLFGLVNATIKPILALATCSMYVVTLGLFHFIVNAFMLQLTGWLAGGWLEVAGFWPAFKAALVISIASTVLGVFLDPGDEDDDEGGTRVIVVRS